VAVGAPHVSSWSFWNDRHAPLRPRLLKDGRLIRPVPMGRQQSTIWRLADYPRNRTA